MFNIYVEVCFVSINDKTTKIFINNETLSFPKKQLQESETLQTLLESIAKECFPEISSTWAIRFLSDPTLDLDQNNLTIKYTCLINEFKSNTGRFIISNTASNLSKLLSTFKVR